MPVAVDEIPVERDPFDQLTCEGLEAIVVIDGTPIPHTVVETTVSTDGNPSHKFLTECHFPSEFNGDSVLSEIRQFEPEKQNAYSQGTVYWRESQFTDDQFYAVHMGFCRGVGGTSKTGVAKLWISDCADFLTAIPASFTYNDPTLTNVLTDVRDEFRAKTIFSNLEIRAPERRTVNAAPENDAAVDRTAFGPAAGFYLWWKGIDPGGDASALSFSKEFQPNRDTLASVMGWLEGAVGGEWYFSIMPDGSTPVLVFDTSPTHNSFASEGAAIQTDDSPAPVEIIENAATQEIAPRNAVTVYGSSAASIGGFTIKEIESSEFPVAEAVYPDLVRRMGSKLSPPIYESDATTLETAENVAEKKLYELLQKSGEGDIHCLGRPDLVPGDKLTALPICRDAAPDSSPPNSLDYQVESVTHTLESGKRFTSRANVSVFVDRDKIEVDSHMKDT